MRWLQFTTQTDLDLLLKSSYKKPCIIFKHSTRCSVSSIAKYRLEEDWDLPSGVVDSYYLDLISHRQVSNKVSEYFGICHESPQVLLIWQGEGIYDASHLDITIEELSDAIRKTIA